MLNPNEAPSGMIAVPYVHCSRCAYASKQCAHFICISSKRTDGTDVHFEKLQPQPDQLNAATHEQPKQTVTISAELSDASVELGREVEIALYQINEDATVPYQTYERLKNALNEARKVGLSK